MNQVTKQVKQKMHSRKINRHEKVCQKMLDGQPKTVKFLVDAFQNTDQQDVMYRLPQFIHNIRLNGGIIRVTKDKRRVTHYQLVNHTKFDVNGRYIAVDSLSK